MAQKRDLGTYQMLWDCPRCDTPKLLGLTHRHCPSCGAPQDPTRRYFPSEEDKVAVEDHRYTGADKVCPNCETPNGAAATFCGNCGSPLDEAKEAARVTERAAQAGQGQSVDAEKKAARRAALAATAAPKKKSGCGFAVVAGLVVAAIAVFALVATFWTREAALEVTGHTWSRAIAIEAFGPQSDSAWCDAVPSGAYDVSRSEKQRGTNKVEDGQTCATKQVDNGDGTFNEVEECKPKYREEPVYDDWCLYTVDRWAKVREAAAAGNSVNDAPRWPEVKLAREGSCVGCERAGGKSETYTVRLKAADGEAHTCTLPESRWKSMAVGSRWKGEVRVMTGGLDCGELKPAQ